VVNTLLCTSAQIIASFDQFGNQRVVRRENRGAGQNSVATELSGEHRTDVSAAFSRIVSMRPDQSGHLRATGSHSHFVSQPNTQLRPTYAVGCRVKASEFVRVPNTLEHLSLDWRMVPIAVNSENNILCGTASGKNSLPTRPP
jgi:hypothetical protein